MQIPEPRIERLPTTLQGNGVLSTDIESVWDEVKVLIEPAIFEDEFSIEDIFQKLKEQKMQLWTVRSEKIICACVTRIEISKRKKFLTILFVGGEDVFSWVEFIHLISDYAKFHGCEELRVFGRKGWGKVLNKYGFDNPLSLFRKKLYG